MTTIIKTVHGTREVETEYKKLGVETLIRETPMHYYTTESRMVTRKYYQIGCGKSWDCTAYASREEAEERIPRTAMLWRWDKTKCYIIEKETQDVVTKNHRWKKG